MGRFIAVLGDPSKVFVGVYGIIPSAPYDSNNISQCPRVFTGY